MRHTTHIMLGAYAASMLKGIKRFIVKYGEDEVNRYFKVFLFPQLNLSTEACFQVAEMVKADDNQFVAGIDEMFEVQLNDFYKVEGNEGTSWKKGWLIDGGRLQEV